MLQKKIFQFFIITSLNNNNNNISYKYFFLKMKNSKHKKHLYSIKKKNILYILIAVHL